MRKIKIIGNVAKRIGKGVIDAILPNLNNSVKPAQTDFADDKKQWEIDYLRMGTAIVAFVGIILLITDTIDIEKLKEIVEAWNLLLQ